MHPDRRVSILCGFLAVLFVVVQVTALAHEMAHATGAHDAPCGLHVAADHLAMAPAPDPALDVPTARAHAAPVTGSDPIPAAPVRCSEARAPPRPTFFREA